MTEQKTPSLLEVLKLALSELCRTCPPMRRSAEERNREVIETIRAAIAAHEQQQNELLEALKACRVKNLLVQAGSLTLLRNALVANNQRIDAAIAKAEGK